MESEMTPTVRQESVGTAAVTAREQHEIQAAIISAKKFPRDENACFLKTLKCFERPSVAEGATYNFRRGKGEVAGPSVQCAREIARCWGNLRYGFRVISDDGDKVQLKGFAFDLETNSFVEIEDLFAKKVQRKNRDTSVTEWVTPDERDLRELTNKRGAIAVRNALLQILPSDFVDAALKQAAETCRAVAAKDLKVSKEDTIRRLVVAFDEIGVSSEMLEKRLGHALSLITEDEIVDLKAVWKSIHDGNSTRDEQFDVKGANRVSASEALKNVVEVTPAG